MGFQIFYMYGDCLSEDDICLFIEIGPLLWVRLMLWLMTEMEEVRSLEYRRGEIWKVTATGEGWDEAVTLSSLN